MENADDLSPETLTAHGAYSGDKATGGVVPPIQPSSTFSRDEAYNLTIENHGYARDKNPTFGHAEALLAKLEGGVDAITFSSGMAAAVAVFQSLRPGDHIVAPKVMYWGLRHWLLEFAENWGLDVDLFDASQDGALAAAIRPGQTRLVWIETPCNPTWDLIDIAAAAEIAHQAGALLAVDSTVATPVLTRPIDLGADIVFHSATKYLNGHSDIVAGALVAARDGEFWTRIRNNREQGGAILGTFESWLLLRGMRTLFLRVRHASDSALALARHFDTHPKVARVLYPGLQSHPGHEIARRQMSGGFGGMLSMQIDGGERNALQTARNCRLFVRATSLGGVESLIEHRATSEGPTTPIPRDLLRLSIGIENPADLIADIDQALAGL